MKIDYKKYFSIKLKAVQIQDRKKFQGALDAALTPTVYSRDNNITENKKQQPAVIGTTSRRQIEGELE